MKDEKKTKRQLIAELVELRRRIAQLEKRNSERTQAKERARAREGKYRSLVESTEDSVYSVDIDGVYQFLNKRCQARLGLPGSQVVGRSYAEFHSEAKTTEFAERLDQVLKTGGPVQYEHTSERDDHFFLRTLSPVKNQQGQITAVAVISKDITERKLAEESLRESEEHYRALVEAGSQLGEAIVLLQNTDKLEAAHLFANEEWARITGYTSEELRKMSYLDLVHPRHRSAVAERLRRRSQGEVLPGPWEIAIVAKDGTEVFTAAAGSPVTLRGKPAIVGYIRDITERKRVEKALWESEKRFRALFDNLTIGVYRTTPDGRVLMANPALVKMLGYSSFEELSGRSLSEVGFEPEYPRSDFLAEIEKTGVIAGLESAWKRKEGSTLFIRESARAVRDNAGKTLYYEGTAEDITERKQVEEQLVHLNAVLRSIRKVNQLITTERDRDRLLEGICVGLTETRSYFHVWVVLLDGASDYVSSFEAGLGKDFSSMQERLKRGELPVCGQKALAQPDVAAAVTDDLLSTCGDCPLSKICADRGTMTIRLEYAGRVYGLLSVSVPDVFVTEEEERDLFKEAAGDIAFALHAIEVEEERRRAEEELRGNEELLSNIIESMGDGIVVLDRDFLYTYWNHAMEQISKTSKEEVLNSGKVAWDLFPHLVEQGVDEMMQKAMRGEVSQREDIPYCLRDGTTGFTSEVFFPLRAEASGIQGIVGVIRDVTERKRAEEELRRMNQYMESIIDSANVWLNVLDKDGNVLLWNKAAEKISGFTREEVVGNNKIWEWNYPDPAYRRVIEGQTKQIIERGKVLDGFETIIHCKNGQTKTMLWSERRLLDASGDPVGSISLGRDITQEKRSVERLHQVLEGTIQAVGLTTETRDPYTAGHQKRVTKLACAIARKMGFPEEQVEGIRVAGLMHDIGKMSVPAEILSKPSRLTEIEFELIKAHPRVAYEILKTIDFPWPVAKVVLQHHERMDGSGYPQGLKGEEIMPEARILAVADVVEAMSSHRPYRPMLGTEKALEEIDQNKRTLYDPDVVTACLWLFSEGGFQFDD